jgi:polysaccharide biosynthesis/export protein
LNIYQVSLVFNKQQKKQNGTLPALMGGVSGLVLCIMAFPTTVMGQELLPAEPAVTSAVQGNGAVQVALPAESLGADDLIELMVSYCPELSRTFRVSSDGSLSLPLLHQKLVVAGLTPTQVAHSLEEALKEEQVLAEPTVNISVLEYRSRPVSVNGAVVHPLTFQATGETTLLDALAKADGLNINAGGNIIVTRKPVPFVVGQSAMQVIRVKDLISGADPQLNIKILGGEEIRVPEAAKIFVAGNVRRPGMYAMQGDTETTVVKAIALSAGLDSYSTNDVFIYRRRASGAERDEVKVPLKLIMAHKSPDVELIADDILYVPSSDGKRLTSRLLNQLAGFGQTAGTGMLIYK